jgi:Mn2+/Fe2+ NRAMP family transporter
VLIYRIVNMSGSYNAAVAAAAFATILACSMSARLVSSHLRNWAKPVEQMLTIVIIAMVPLFAVDSFIGLLEVKATVCTQLLNAARCGCLAEECSYLTCRPCVFTPNLAGNSCALS